MTRTAPAPPHPRLMTAKQVAVYLNIGLRTVYELVESGTLERCDITGKPGSKRPALRIPTESVEAYYASLTTAAP